MPMQERVEVCLSMAAVEWSRHLMNDGASANRVMDALGLAAAEASRWRAEAGGGPPLRPAELVECLSRPMAEWLPEGEGVCLLEAGEPTAWTQEVAELQGADPLLEAQQRVILTALDTLQVREDGERQYAELRQFLIDHPLALASEVRARLIPLGLAFSDCYQSVPAPCLRSMNGEDVCYPCPRCGWPMSMHRRTGAMRCHAVACVAEGVRFGWLHDRPVPTGNKAWDARPVPVAGRVRLTPGLWRYTVLPGLWELDLARRLRRIPGVEVALWPRLDLYDLDVRHGARQWRVDVKDHRSPRRLLELLRQHPPSVPTHVVIPDGRRADLSLLRHGAGPESLWRFETCSGFVRLVRREIRV